MPAQDGWFDDATKRLYDRLAVAGPDAAPLVEVGVWLGHSVIYLAQRVKEHRRLVQVYAVDTFDGGTGPTPEMAAFVAERGGSLLSSFLCNARAAGVQDVVCPIQGASTAVAAAWARRFSPPFAVFLDADHRYEAVQADIAAWLPLVRPGGVLAGHDYDDEGVRRAVTEAFGQDVSIDGLVWRHTKK